MTGISERKQNKWKLFFKINERLFSEMEDLSSHIEMAYLLLAQRPIPQNITEKFHKINKVKILIVSKIKKYKGLRIGMAPNFSLQIMKANTLHTALQILRENYFLLYIYIYKFYIHIDNYIYV